MEGYGWRSWRREIGWCDGRCLEDVEIVWDEQARDNEQWEVEVPHPIRNVVVALQEDQFVLEAGRDVRAEGSNVSIIVTP